MRELRTSKSPNYPPTHRNSAASQQGTNPTECQSSMRDGWSSDSGSDVSDWITIRTRELESALRSLLVSRLDSCRSRNSPRLCGSAPVPALRVRVYMISRICSRPKPSHSRRKSQERMGLSTNGVQVTTYGNWWAHGVT